MNDETKISTIEAPFQIDTIKKHGPLSRDDTSYLVELAKLITWDDLHMPPHYQAEAIGNERTARARCFGLLMKSVAWNIPDYYWLAEHSYLTEKGAVQRLGWDSSVFHAGLLRSGAVRGRAQYDYSGEGDDMTCTVSIDDAKTGRAESYTSPPLSRCRPGRNDKGQVRGSPLWDKDPKQQLGYYTVRNLVRLKFPDVMAGFYDREEFDEIKDVTPTQASPNLMERLPGRIEGEGFAETNTEAAAEEAQALEKAEAVKQTRSEAMKAAWAKRKAAKASGKRSDPEGVGETTATAKATPEPPLPVPEAAPATKAEYVDMVRHTIRSGASRKTLYNWFLTETQARLRQACKVDDLTTNMLYTLVKEA